MSPKKVYPYHFLILPLVIYIVLFFLPSIFSFYYAMTDWNIFTDKIRFVGLDNFKTMIHEWKTYLKYFENTVIFAISSTVLKNVLGLALALLLWDGLRTKNTLRTIFYIPATISPLIIGLIFTSIFNANNGMINSFFISIGLDSWAQGWLIDVKLAMASIVTVETWKFIGFNMIIYLAGLQTISKTFYDAASIDGAGKWKRLVHITMPLIMPALTINLILNLINGFKVFDLIFVLTNGGPGSTTEVLNTAVFREFTAGRYGMATALGVLLFIITSIVALSTLSLLTRKGAVEE